MTAPHHPQFAAHQRLQQPHHVVPAPSAPHGRAGQGVAGPGFQQHPQRVPPAFLQFTTQGGFLTSSFIPPRVSCNGYAVAVPNYGTTIVPVQPGQLTIEAHMRYIWGPYGHAGLHLHVQPGQTVPVFYAPPLALWSEGRMGVAPQERQGLASYITLVSVCAAVPLAALIAAIAVAIVFA